MTDDVILVTENGQTKLQAFTGTVSGNVVKAESAVLVDSNLAPVGTSGNPVRTDPTGATTQPVSGSVNVGNFPATQPVSGTVAASNLQQWMGSSAPTVGQKTKAASLPVTIASDQGVLGSVNQGTPAGIANAWPTKLTDGANTASLQPDTGIYATGKTGIIPMFFDGTSSWTPLILVPGQYQYCVPVSIQGAGIGVLLGKENSFGSLAAVGSAIILNSINGYSGSIAVTGPFDGTIIFEASDPSTFNWFQIPVKRIGLVEDWVTQITGVDAPAYFQLPHITGLVQVRARSTSWNSGTASFNTFMTALSQTNPLHSGPPAKPVPPELLSLGGSDPKGLLRPLQVDPSGNLIVSVLQAQTVSANYGPTGWGVDGAWGGSW